MTRASLASITSGAVRSGTIEQMSYDPKTKLHRCDSCRRAMDNGRDLTDMRKPGVLEPMRICAAHRCWNMAAELGYLSGTQRRRAPGDGQVAAD